MKALLISAAFALATVVGTAPASAWIGVHGGGAVWHGPNGGGAVWHGGVAGGGWGVPYGPRWDPCCWGGVAAGAAVGVAAGIAIGTRVATLPDGCATLANGNYACGTVSYRPYYSNNGVVYEVVEVN